MLVGELELVELSGDLSAQQVELGRIGLAAGPDDAEALLGAGLGNDVKVDVLDDLVRRLADPIPSDEGDDRPHGSQTSAGWDDVRRRCLSLSVAILEEAG